MLVERGYQVDSDGVHGGKTCQRQADKETALRDIAQFLLYDTVDTYMWALRHQPADVRQRLEAHRPGALDTEERL